MTINLTEHPIRAHQISRYNYCAEMSRLNVALGIHPEFTNNKAIDGGIRLHEWLDKRPRSKSESELESRLDSYAKQRGWYDRTDISKPERDSRYFLREYMGCTIKVHPDDFVLKWNQEAHKSFVMIREYKGVASLSSAQNPFSLVQYRAQLQTYIWAMRPIIESLGYTLAQTHPIAYRNRNTGDFVLDTQIPMLPDADYELKLDYIFRVWKGEIEPIPPKWFKCKDCPLLYKRACGIRQKWLDSKGGFFVEDADKRLWRPEDLKEPVEPLGDTKGAEPLDFEDLWRLGLGDAR